VPALLSHNVNTMNSAISLIACTLALAACSEVVSIDRSKIPSPERSVAGASGKPAVAPAAGSGSESADDAGAADADGGS
jgi:hypothetical protein